MVSLGERKAEHAKKEAIERDVGVAVVPGEGKRLNRRSECV